MHSRGLYNMASFNHQARAVFAKLQALGVAANATPCKRKQPETSKLRFLAGKQLMKTMVH